MLLSDIKPLLEDTRGRQVLDFADYLDGYSISPRLKKVFQQLGSELFEKGWTCVSSKNLRFIKGSADDGFTLIFPDKGLKHLGKTLKKDKVIVMWSGVTPAGKLSFFSDAYQVETLLDAGLNDALEEAKSTALS